MTKDQGDKDEPFDKRVSSIPLDTDPDGAEGGRPVVIQQENAGPGEQAGGGEFKNVDHAPTPDEVAQRQAELEAEAPTDPATRPQP